MKYDNKGIEDELDKNPSKRGFVNFTLKTSAFQAKFIRE